MVHFLIEKHMIDTDFFKFLKNKGKQIIIHDVTLNTTGGWNSSFEKIINFWRNYILLSVSSLANSNKYDTFVTWQVFVGVFTGIIIKLFGLKRKLIILSFIYRERKNIFIKFFRYYFTKFGLSAANMVICYSSYEAEYYKALFNLTKTNFVPLQLGKSFEDSFEKINNSQSDYIFSAGQSNRDYDTLIKIYDKIELPLLIATTNKLIIPSFLGEKISLKQLTGEEFQKALYYAKIVVIPLCSTNVSSGQIVLINAMAYGKCVIITEANWTKDYLTHGENAWIVPPKDSKALAEAIRYISINDNIRKKIGDNAREYYKQNLSGEAFANRLIKIIEV